MSPRVRWLLLAVAAAQAVFALVFWFQLPLVGAIWPWPATSPLSATFIASIFAAAAASTAWCAVFRRERALAGIALDYLVIFVPFTLFSALRAAQGAGTGVAAFAVACGFGVVIGAGILRYSLRFGWRNAAPAPALARVSFAVFVVALVLAGSLLVLGTPNVLPWTVTPDLSVLFGFIFLGAAAYFVFALAQPVADNVPGQLAGFLLYDVVLLGPFLVRLPTIDDAFRLSLLVYLAALIYSTVLALYYLLLHPTTRIVGQSELATEAATGG